MSRTLIALMAVFGTATFSNLGLAQIRSYMPPGGQTLPNQLEYFRPQQGFLDQYNQFVAPRENLANQLGALAGQQNADFESVQSRMRESELIRESEAAATGTAAGFMNYSHYYRKTGSLAGGGGRRPVAAARRYTPRAGGAGTGMALPGGIGSGMGGGGVF